MLDLGRRREARGDQSPPSHEVVRFAKVHDMAFERLPLNQQAIALRLFDRTMQGEAFEPPRSREQRKGRADAGLELGCHSRLDVDLGVSATISWLLEAPIDENAS
jgi:hypothetical protein